MEVKAEQQLFKVADNAKVAAVSEARVFSAKTGIGVGGRAGTTFVFKAEAIASIAEGELGAKVTLFKPIDVKVAVTGCAGCIGEGSVQPQDLGPASRGVSRCGRLVYRSS